MKDLLGRQGIEHFCFIKKNQLSRILSSRGGAESHQTCLNSTMLKSMVKCSFDKRLETKATVVNMVELSKYCCKMFYNV